MPKQFEERRVDVLHQLIRTHPLATLVALTPDGLDANHIPLEIDAEPAPSGTLRGHVSRANPVWRHLRPDVEVLAIFQGPQTYVTPSWYVTKAEGGKVVPTWNYAVVHAYGPPRTIDDPAWLRRLVGQLTDRHEAGRQPRWMVSDAPDDYIERQLQGIVGIEIPITRLIGKWKISQNREPRDRAAVIEGLEREGRQAAADIARVMRTAGEPRDP